MNKAEKRKYERKQWRYFYYNGKAHRTLAVNRGRDEILAWCYSAYEKRIYSWIDVKRNGYPALLMKDVSKIVDRAPRTIYAYVRSGLIAQPERSYSLKTGRPGLYLWSRDDVYELYEMLKTMHFGRPRHDAFITAWNVPDRNEVRAAANSGLFVYAKTDTGEFVPVWKTEEF